MKGSRFPSSHVLRVYVHRVHQSLHTGHVPVAAGLEQLPERAPDAAAAVGGAGSSGARAGDAAAAAAGGRRSGARTARQDRGRQVRGGQGRVDPPAAFPLALRAPDGRSVQSHRRRGRGSSRKRAVSRRGR